MDEQDPVCIGCHRSIEEGSVVAFGEGEDAYHADCFRCTQCDSKIEDLVFAKTSQGIYCMKCHQERKEAKRQREERERMERAEKMMEKILPTIPEGSKPSAASAYRDQSYENQQHGLSLNGFSHPSHSDHQNQPLPKLPSQESHSYGGFGANGSNIIPSLRTDSHPKTNGPSLPSLDVGPPLLPPLTFGLDDISSVGFDLGEMLGTPAPKDTSQDSSTISSPVPSTKDEEIVKDSEPNSYRLSISRASARLSMSSPSNSEKSSINGDNKSLPDTPKTRPVEIPLLSLPEVEVEAECEEELSHSEALILVRELRLEVAKHNPTSPLLYGTPQLQFGLLKDKVDKLTQQHSELEKSVRDLYIEKDLLGMDLDAMNQELAAKEEELAANSSDSLKPRPVTHSFRMSTSHDLMKQSYQLEVKALQDQKELLQQEIRHFVEQRDRILDEMQILSVRNAELSTINNDMMREMQGRKDKDAKAAPAAPSSSFNASMLTSFTGKMRRQRQMSGGNNQELKAQNLVAGSNESTLSFVSTNSDGSRSQQGSKARKDERQEDIFGEEIVTPKKFNWKKGTINTMNSSVNTVKHVGAMFGKLLVEAPAGQDVSSANGKAPTMMSDNGSSNGQILPPSRSFSAGSDNRSLNGQYAEQHFFIQHNYIKPTRCDCCDDKIWGREYKCRGCGFQVHGRCTHEIIPGCSGRFKDSDSSSIRNLTPSGESGHGIQPSSPKLAMFGNSLIDQLEIEQRSVPLVVEKCIEAVDERGLEVEGIYRRSGMAVEARQLVQAFDAGHIPDLMDTCIYQDICSITSVLKQYLRTLPEPLIPYDFYGDFMDATGLPHTDDKYDIFRELMERMPIAHYQTLKVLLEHLNRVVELDHINLMTSKNLSVVFGPTLMRNPDPSREILDMTSKNLTIEFLIVNTHQLFVRAEKTSGRSHGQNLAGGSSSGPSNGSDGFPAGFTGQRQGSLGSIGQMVPPPRRVPNHTGHPNAPVLPPRSSSGDAIPTMNQGQQQPHYHQQQQQQQQYNGQHMYQQQQQQPQQHLFRPQQFQQPQLPTLQQLKQQQQQREQFQRDQRQQQQMQQMLQEQQKREQEQEVESEQEEPITTVPSSPPSVATQPSSPLPSQLPSMAQQQQQQRQQANPDIDMTHFP
ncbi:hypothetical protein FBU30_004452 [Linnemannia zychae]|nr:hypothetical protein FBU30_004452 [Linnemannia zychae]